MHTLVEELIFTITDMSTGWASELLASLMVLAHAIDSFKQFGIDQMANNTPEARLIFENANLLYSALQLSCQKERPRHILWWANLYKLKPQICIVKHVCGHYILVYKCKEAKRV